MDRAHACPCNSQVVWLSLLASVLQDGHRSQGPLFSNQCSVHSDVSGSLQSDRLTENRVGTLTKGGIVVKLELKILT